MRPIVLKNVLEFVIAMVYYVCVRIRLKDPHSPVKQEERFRVDSAWLPYTVRQGSYRLYGEREHIKHNIIHTVQKKTFHNTVSQCLNTDQQKKQVGNNFATASTAQLKITQRQAREELNGQVCAVKYREICTMAL